MTLRSYAIKVSKTDPFRKGVVVYLARRHRDNTLSQWPPY